MTVPDNRSGKLRRWLIACGIAVGALAVLWFERGAIVQRAAGTYYARTLAEAVLANTRFANVDRRIAELDDRMSETARRLLASEALLEDNKHRLASSERRIADAESQREDFARRLEQSESERDATVVQLEEVERRLSQAERRLADNEAAVTEAKRLLRRGAGGAAIRNATLDCLSPEKILSVRSSPTSIAERFQECKSELSAKLGSKFGAASETDMLAVFASIVANRMAPYGESTKLRLEDLLTEQKLDCDNYVALTSHLFSAAGVTGGRMKIVGFHGGAVGNHAQIFYEGQMNLLLDPTVALVASGAFDEVLKGLPVDAVVTFYAWNDPDITPFRDRVATALDHGDYQPSDLLYYFGTPGEFLAWAAKAHPVIHSDPAVGYSVYLTPGGERIRKDILSR